MLKFSMLSGTSKTPIFFINTNIHLYGIMVISNPNHSILLFNFRTILRVPVTRVTKEGIFKLHFLRTQEKAT